MRVSGRRRAAIVLAAMALSGCSGLGAHDATQLVHKDRAAVYDAFAGAFEDGAMGGAQQYSNLWHGGLQILVSRVSETKLDVVTKFDGKTSSEVQFTFDPKDGDKATLVNADVAVDRTVMHDAFAGTPQEKMGNLPRLSFTQGMQRLMKRYGERIESGAALNDLSHGWQTAQTDPPAEFYDGMPPDQLAEIRRHDQEAEQENKAAPMMDPDAAARQYLHGGQ